MSSTANLPPGASVPASYVRLLYDYLDDLGLDGAAMLGAPAPGPGPGPGPGPALSFPALRWCALLASAAQQLQDPLLGLHVGATITPAHLGPLGYVLLASNNAGAALARYLACQRLIHDVSPVRHYLDGERLVLEWGAQSRAMGLLANQCGMAALARFASIMTGACAAAAPVGLDFVEARPADFAAYQSMFGCPVRFGQDAMRIVFAASLLAQPLCARDPALVALLERQIDTLLAALPASDDLADAVRRQSAQLLLQGEPALDAVARALHLSGRTLRRRLAERGWQFRALLDDTRHRLAQDYLRDQRLALPEVALLLGYSEQSAFSRAFLRWSGVTPARWRARTLQVAQNSRDDVLK